MNQSVVQLGLFEENGRLPLVVAGLIASIKAAMNKAAANSSLSRAQIVDRMNVLAQDAGVRLTKGNAKSISEDTLAQWLNPSERSHTPSLLAVNVFCLAVGNVAPLSAQLAVHGCSVMGDEDRRYRDYGKACVNARAAAKQKRKIEEEIS